MIHKINIKIKYVSFRKTQTFGLGQTFSPKIFEALIRGILGQTISTHFGTVSSLSMFSIMQPLFLKKTKPLHPMPNLFGSGILIWAANNFRFSLPTSVVRGMYLFLEKLYIL